MIPPALAGKDILAQSRTGTGKTAAFGLPILQKLEPDTPFQTLILAPTRELAVQVGEDLRKLSHFTPVRVVPVYGGQRIRIQADRLKRNPSVVVGTPGRVMDMHGRGLLPYDNVRFAVLDEVDRMLDIGFRDDIDLRVRNDLRRNRAAGPPVHAEPGEDRGHDQLHADRGRGQAAVLHRRALGQEAAAGAPADP
ncbi:MAG: DEAD/DEAH box helicase, partial [Planctomycetota bacterium]